MSQLDLFFTLFIDLMVTSLPFLLLGVALSSFLAVFVDDHRWVDLFPRNRVLGAIVGSALGLLLPVGQYGSIPVARRFFAQGVPLSVVFSFLVAAPTLNIFTLWLTWRTFGGNEGMLFYRSISVWLIAVGIGILFSFYRDTPADTSGSVLESSLSFEENFTPPDGNIDPLQRVGNLVYEYKPSVRYSPSLKSSLPAFLKTVVDDLPGFAAVLSLGCLLASLFFLFLAPDAIVPSVDNSVVGVLVSIFFGLTLGINSSLSALVPGSWLTTLSLGSVLAFSIVSSLINIQSSLLLLYSFRSKLVFYFFMLILCLTLVVSLALNFYSI